jgi:hypothetical protein
MHINPGLSDAHQTGQEWAKGCSAREITLNYRCGRHGASAVEKSRAVLSNGHKLSKLDLGAYRQFIAYL